MYFEVVHVLQIVLHSAPSEGPDATVENLGKHEATITWKEVAKAEANGDIVNYTVFYKPEDGEELGMCTYEKQKIRWLINSPVNGSLTLLLLVLKM